jgi:PAS domain S-box-containing protein
LLSGWKIIDINQAYIRWTGYSREELIGSLAEDLRLWVHPDDREKIAGMLRTTGEDNSEEMLVRQKNDNVRIVFFSARFMETERELKDKIDDLEGKS